MTNQDWCYEFLAALADHVEQGGKVTFSRNCRTGLLQEGEVCNCWRCRKERGEEVTDETEARAERESNESRAREREQP